MPFVTAGDLLERGRELETLRAGLDRACAGEGTVLLIEGPAGAGKTALAHAAADQAPMVTLQDDCQWADRDSLRFLAYLAQRIEGLPVAMLVTGRPDAAEDEGAAVWAQMASRPAAIVLRPRQLSADAVAALVRERLATEPAQEFCRACHAATGGNPLFLRELLRSPRGPRSRRRRTAPRPRQRGPSAASRCSTAAQALFVTEKTIERHLSSAYQKLSIRSRVQLAAALQLP